MGGLFGGLLHSGGHEVVFVEREDKIPKLKFDGLMLEMPDSSVVRVKADFRANLKGVEGADLCVVTVKAYDTKSAVNHIASANLKCP